MDVEVTLSFVGSSSNPILAKTELCTESLLVVSTGLAWRKLHTSYGPVIIGRCQKNRQNFAFRYTNANDITESQCVAWCDQAGDDCVGYSWRTASNQCVFHMKASAVTVAAHSGGNTGVVPGSHEMPYTSGGVPNTGTPDATWACHPRVAVTVQAQVTHSKHGKSNLATVATVTHSIGTIPVVAQLTRNFATAATNAIVSGHKFGTVRSDIRVYFGVSKEAIGSASTLESHEVGVATGELSCANIALSAAAGNTLFARVVVQGVQSDVVAIGKFVTLPVVTAASYKVAQAAYSRIEILGKHFGSDCSDLTVTFKPSVASTVATCNDTHLVLDTIATSSLPIGDLEAVVTRSGGASQAGAFVKIGKISASISAPAVTASVAPASFMETRLTVSGSNFGTAAEDVRVYLFPHGGPQPTANILAMADTKLVLAVRGLSERNAGKIRAVVTRQGVTSAIAAVATLEEIIPEVALVGPLHSPIEGGSVVTISGKNFQYDTLRCVWGSALSTTNAEGNGTVATCKTPKHAVGNATLSVQTTRGLKSIHTHANVYFYPTLLVADTKHNRVVRFNAYTGQFVDVFVQESSGGLNGPEGLAFSPDHNLAVASSQTKNILLYNGTTGVFIREFAKISGSPKGIVFHYGDLYVCGGRTRKIHRFHGITGSPRGVFYQSQNLRYPYAIMFDSMTNVSFVADMLQNNIVRMKPQVSLFDESSSAKTPKAWDAKFSKSHMKEVRSFDMTKDSVYVTSPASGFAVMQFNRTTGDHIYNVRDVDLVSPSDVKVWNNYLHVCGENQVRKYNRFDGEFMSDKAFVKYDMKCSFMLFHNTWNPNQGS